MKVHGYTANGAIDATIDGHLWTVPDDPVNRYRQMIRDQWEFDEDGNRVNTIPPYAPPPVDHMALLRQERDKRLTDSDWVILRNLETSESVPQAWLDYRQALRDMPETTTDPTNPDWPETPG